MSELQKRLRAVQSIRRDATPLSVAVALCSEAADALDAKDAEIAALRAQLREEQDRHCDTIGELGELRARLAAEERECTLRGQRCADLTLAHDKLSARLAEAERDAERLDWLIDNFWIALNGREARAMTREQIDAARGGA